MKTIVLQTSQVQAICIAEHGLVITSFLDVESGAEAFWRRPGFTPAQVNRSLGPSGAASVATFLDIFVGGCFEMFPTPGSPGVSNGVATLLHGEAPRLPWEVVKQTDQRLEAQLRLVRSQFSLHRVIELAGNRLSVTSTARNEANAPLAYAWGFHPCFRRETFRGGNVQAGVKRALVVGPEPEPGQNKFEAGLEFTWPDAVRADGGLSDVSEIPNEPDGRHDHVSLTTAGSDLVVTAPAHGRELRMSRDHEIFPHLLYWQNYCAPGAPFWGSVDTFALEPLSYFGRDFDDAQKRDELLWLDPGDTSSTAIQFAWERP